MNDRELAVGIFGGERKIKEQMDEEVEGAKESHLNSSKVREQNKHRQEDRV